MNKATCTISAFRSRRTFVPLLAFLLILQVYIPGAALCLEADGNAAIEYYSGGNCADAIAVTVSDELSYSRENSGDEHCGACIDVPVTERASYNNVFAGNEIEADIVVHSLPAYTLTSFPYHPQPDNKAFFHESGEFSPLPVSLKNTVLTC